MSANSRMFGKSLVQRGFNMLWIFLIGVYAGYSMRVRVFLCLTLLSIINRQESFAINNALKNVAMTATNTTAWIVFALETPIRWHYVLPLMIGNIIGGILGPIIVRHLPGRLMQILVGIGALILAVSLTIRNFS